jgi:hypothetical protein
MALASKPCSVKLRENEKWLLVWATVSRMMFETALVDPRY